MQAPPALFFQPPWSSIWLPGLYVPSPWICPLPAYLPASEVGATPQPSLSVAFGLCDPLPGRIQGRKREGTVRHSHKKYCSHTLAVHSEFTRNCQPLFTHLSFFFAPSGTQAINTSCFQTQPDPLAGIGSGADFTFNPPHSAQGLDRQLFHLMSG